MITLVPLKDKEEIQEVTVSQAAAKGTSVDAAVVTVLSVMDGIFIEEEQFLSSMTLPT